MWRRFPEPEPEHSPVSFPAALTVGHVPAGSSWKCGSKCVVLPVEVVAVTHNLKHGTEAEGTPPGHRQGWGVTRDQAGCSAPVPCCPQLGRDLVPGARDATAHVRESPLSGSSLGPGGGGGEAQIRTRFQGANALHRVSEGNSSSKCNGDIRQGDRQRRQKGGSQISVTRTSVAIELLP